EDSIVGFMIYELQKTRLHLLNFAVQSKQRRRRVGSQMIEKLTGKLSPHRRNQILLEVRETNLPAQLFFRAVGFSAMGVLRDFYDDSTEDAYEMKYFHGSAKEAAWPVNRIGGRLAG
ncbi:MAG: GNAT family N-acetyltransferase, partial [Planctomycetales bacterium]